MSEDRSLPRSVVMFMPVVTVILVSLPVLFGCATRNLAPRADGAEVGGERRGATPSTSPSQTHKERQVPSYVRAVSTFLMAWGKGNWAEARSVAAEQVLVRIGGDVWALDLSAGQAEVALIFPFRGISAVRVEGEVKGVIVDEVGLKVGEVEKRGPGTVTLERKDGEYRVTAVSVP